MCVFINARETSRERELNAKRAASAGHRSESSRRGAQCGGRRGARSDICCHMQVRRAWIWYSNWN